MSKHLNNKEIIKYRQAALLPTELLTVDSHLADCENCRRRIRQRQDLPTLYESFFEPLGEFSVNDSKDADSGKRENWKLLKKLRFFSLATILTNRQPQAAVILVLFLTVAGIWLFLQKPTPPADYSLSAGSLEENPVPDNLANGNVPTPQTVKPFAAVKDTETVNSDDSGLMINKPGANKILAARKEAAAKPFIKLEISELEADNSRQLNSETDAAEERKPSPKLQISERRNDAVIDFSTVENADEYEIYLAEMPKFVTVSREKVKLKRWTIPSQNLKLDKIMFCR